MSRSLGRAGTALRLQFEPGPSEAEEKIKGGGGVEASYTTLQTKKV